jgi:DNA-binding HxlR family transcriptional regulator
VTAEVLDSYFRTGRAGSTLKTVSGYGQYCPIALGAEVFAERWTPIILRNLLVGCEHFGQILDGAPGLSRSVLAQRLRRLEHEGIVERVPAGPVAVYRLTECGHELAQVVLALGAWGARWREARPEQQDPYLMLWALSRLIDPSTLPTSRVVVRFELPEARGPVRYWVLAGGQGNEVCVTPPGFAEDGTVRTDPAWLYRWHCGHVTLAQAERAGGMVVTGPRWLHRMLSDWGRLSPFNGIVPVKSVICR